MNISEGLLILAALAGPVLAVQAQKWIERYSESRKRKMNLFFTLMATRAARLSFEHVRALNMIEMEFYNGKSATEREVLDTWRIYHDHFNQISEKSTDAQLTTWLERGDDLFTDLLHAMSRALGYKFDRVQLKRGAYYPKAHGDEETAQRQIRDSLRSILSGEKPLPMAVTSFAAPPGTNERQAELQRLFTAVLSGKTPLKITIESGDKT